MSTTTDTDLATRYEVAVREIKQLRASLAEANTAHRRLSARHDALRRAAGDVCAADCEDSHTAAIAALRETLVSEAEPAA